MSSIPPFDAISAQLRESLDSFAQSLNACFDSEWQLELAEPELWTDSHSSLETLSQAGLFAVFRMGDDGGYLIAIPETAPLPGWYRAPSDSQKSRLATMAVEWAYQIFPEEFQEAEATSVEAHDLATAIRWSSPLAGAQAVEIRLRTSDDQWSPGSLWLIGPVETPPSAHAGLDDDAHDDEHGDPSGRPGYGEEDFGETHSNSADHEAAQQALARIRRLLHLNVTVSVRLAEMKIDLATLINLSPGTLLVFPKSCDDLLDLYVNNRLYAQGEAVKIGEKFGLKVNQVGVVKQRKSGVFSL